MIFVYLYLGGLIAKTILKFNWLSIPWAQIAPIFSAISALAACISVIASILMANKNRKSSEINNKNNLEASKRNNEINVAATRQNNFDNLFFKLLDLLNKNVDAIENVNGDSFDASKLISSIKENIEEKRYKRSIDKQRIFVKKNKERLSRQLVILENLELSEIRKNKGKISGTNNCRKSCYNHEISGVEELAELSKNMFTEKEEKGESKVWTWSEVMYNILDEIDKNEYDMGRMDIRKTGMLFSDQFNGLLKDVGNNKSVLKNCETISDPFYEIDNSENILQHTDIKDAISEEFCLIKFGSFFSIVNRIVKIIKDQYKDDVINQNKYVGILRTQIPSLLLVCVYYNAEYLGEGKKLQANLKDLELWGDKEELENNIHINATMFYNAGKEIDNIIENYTRNDYEEGVVPEKN